MRQAGRLARSTAGSRVESVPLRGKQVQGPNSTHFRGQKTMQQLRRLSSNSPAPGAPRGTWRYWMPVLVVATGITAAPEFSAAATAIAPIVVIGADVPLPDDALTRNPSNPLIANGPE